MEYPYQLVTFFDRQPMIGEFVYEGDNGWYPQIALKRRFAFNGLTEEQGLEKVKAYLAKAAPFTVTFGDRVRPDRMPVDVIEVVDSPGIIFFHEDFIAYMGDTLVSRYPERDGANYSPHMTVTWAGHDVVDTQEYAHNTRRVSAVWVLKDDGPTGDSKAFKSYSLSGE